LTTPGFFEVYPDMRPALPAGTYSATSHQALTAAPPHGADGTITVDDTEFFVHIDSPRFVMPPDQILSTFPPAGSQGDWRERLPQIVLKRRTMPYERNPGPSTAAPPVGPPPPDPDPATAPPWLALVVLAEGEGRLSQAVDVAQCVTPGVHLGDDADVPQGTYLEVAQSVVHTVFPCLDELALLTHVRKVDLSDTELALGDDDGYLAVVLSSRLPQPAPPTSPGGDPTPVKYTACLVNLERQLPSLLPTEPAPVHTFNGVDVLSLVDQQLLRPAPNATIDQIAMNLGPGARSIEAPAIMPRDAGPSIAETRSTAIAPYAPGARLETAAASWRTGPAGASPTRANDLAVTSGFAFGVNAGLLTFADQTLRFPVLVSWQFTATGDGGFERLMNKLDVGLLGTLDAAQPPPLPEVAPTGHVALAHRTRQGEPARSWYRGPVGPQPTERVMPVDGTLPLAHTGDQLRTVVPDGREDISLAALFEIGRLLTLSKPALVASLIQWRRELFGAARARELADALSGGLFAGLPTSAIGGRTSLEGLLRKHFVGTYTGLAPGALAPRAQVVPGARLPDALTGLAGAAVLAGLGVDPQVVMQATAAAGAQGLATVAVSVAATSAVPVSQDAAAVAALSAGLSARIDQLVADSLQATATPAARSRRARPSSPADTLDRLIAEADSEGER
jgi:hypothetical protein